MPVFDNSCFFKTFFKVCCSLAVVLMISYWILKYSQDEDLCLVDYISIQEVKEESLPVLSVCFYHPFIEDTFKQLDPKFNATYYVEHLSGNVFEEKFQQTEYETLAFNLREYVRIFVVGWRNGTRQVFKTNDTQHVVHFSNTFNGFLYGSFARCFGLGVNDNFKKEVSYSQVYFERTDDLDTVLANPDYTGYTILHYPNQFLLVSINLKPLIIDKNQTVNSEVYYTVDSVEILKRRNKHKEPCKSNYENFDRYLIKKHIEDAQCRPLYLTELTQYPVCNAQNMKSPKFGLGVENKQRYVRPCLGMSKVGFHYITENTYLVDPRWFGVGVIYPEQIKVISQSQAVDLHSLVGNIGGYIGLFLGIVV